MIDLMTWFRAPGSKANPRRGRAGGFQCEALEPRELMTWGGAPFTLGYSPATNVALRSNVQAGVAVVRAGEVDVYNFVAPRTGTYTFSATAFNSKIDPIAGLYTNSGNLIAARDTGDGTTNSHFTANVVAGGHYSLAVTNLAGSSNGAYRWEIDGPALSVTNTRDVAYGMTSTATATLQGNALTVALSAQNATAFAKHLHKVDVYLVDANNKAIRSAHWTLAVKTGGIATLVASSTGVARTFNVAGFDLRAMRNIRVVVS